MNTNHYPNNGFTMVEIILTLVLLGGIAGMFAPYFASGVNTSSTPIFRVEDTAELQETMENIINWQIDRASSNFETASGNLSTEEIIDQNILAIFTPTPESPGSDLTDLQSEINNITQFAPTGFTPTVVQNQIVNKLSTYTSGLAAATDQNQALLVTLRGPEGGTLSYIFMSGSNFPRFLSNP